MKKQKTCACGSIKITNSFFSLCAICNKERLKGKKQTIDKSKDKSGFAKSIKSTRFDGILYNCEGCGKNKVAVDCSHIIPVSLRKDLQFDKQNAHAFCRDCHNIWEHGSQEQQKALLTFDQDMEYIKSIDQHLYNRKIVKP